MELVTAAMTAGLQAITLSGWLLGWERRSQKWDNQRVCLSSQQSTTQKDFCQTGFLVSFRMQNFTAILVHSKE